MATEEELKKAREIASHMTFSTIEVANEYFREMGGMYHDSKIHVAIDKFAQWLIDNGYIKVAIKSNPDYQELITLYNKLSPSNQGLFDAVFRNPESVTNERLEAAL